MWIRENKFLRDKHSWKNPWKDYFGWNTWKFFLKNSLRIFSTKQFWNEFMGGFLRESLQKKLENFFKQSLETFLKKSLRNSLSFHRNSLYTPEGLSKEFLEAVPPRIFWEISKLIQNFWFCDGIDGRISEVIRGCFLRKNPRRSLSGSPWKIFQGISRRNIWKECERNSGEISEKKNVLEFQKQFKQDFQKLIPRRFSKEISTAVSQAFHIRFLD